MNFNKDELILIYWALDEYCRACYTETMKNSGLNPDSDRLLGNIHEAEKLMDQIIDHKLVVGDNDVQ